MKENTLTKGRAFRWKQFSHKAYAVFFSLKREVNIGVLSVSTVVCASVATATAQTPDTPQQMKNYELAEIEVTGTRVPLTELESAKMVTVLSRADIQAAAVHSINDLLKYAAGVDVRQRGEFGVQTDISVRGGTFDQVTILLNGVNITDSQTGHHSADFPVSMNDIERIEVLEGPAARVFGTSAFTGAINIVTRKEQHNSSLQANLMGGDYGLFGGGARVNYAKGPLANTVSASYNRSDGATNNSDFRIGRAYYQGLYTSGQVDVQWQLGFSDQAFGANTFYSAAYPNQYEELRRYMASVRAETKGALRFSPTVYWNRKYDNFQLVRGDDFGQNFHLNDVHGINLNAHFNTGLGKTAFGAEFRNEGIRSSNLGKPYQEQGRYTKKDNRTNISYYLEHTVLLRQWTISVGAMANMNTALDHKYRLYPGVDISYRPARNWKLFASWNMALRMPTFTDLYYKSPTIEGNIGLKPEETRAISAGARYRTPVVDASLSAFFNKGKNMIDWVMRHQEDTYHSANFKLDNMGLEATAGIDFRQLMSPATFLGRLHISYAYIHQKRHDDTQVYKSNYALEYLRHKLVARLDHRIWKELHANWAFRWQDRMGSYLKEGGQVPYSAFGLLDLKLVWQGKSYQLFAEVNNVFNRRYYDFGSVPQPGGWVRAGINISCPLQFFRR